jgi:hypothetical protein
MLILFTVNFVFKVVIMTVMKPISPIPVPVSFITKFGKLHLKTYHSIISFCIHNTATVLETYTFKPDFDDDHTMCQRALIRFLCHR